MYSVIIPSNNLSNLKACVKALRDAGETCRVFVVWDGPEWPTSEDRNLMVISGRNPFCWSRNVNMGIQAAGTDDVIVMGDDILLQTPSGLGWMAQAWSRFGIVSARIKGPAHPIHAGDMPRGGYADITGSGFVPFCCVFLRRKMLDEVGLLDERFVPGGYEDNDLCMRAVLGKSAWRIGVANMTVVDHETLPHAFRPEGKPDLYELPANRARFIEKWGMEPKR